MMSGHWLRHMSPDHRARSGPCRMAACICAKILDLHIYLYRGLKIRSITQFALSPPILYYSLCMLYVYVLMGRDGLTHNKVSIYLSIIGPSSVTLTFNIPLQLFQMTRQQL